VRNRSRRQVRVNLKTKKAIAYALGLDVDDLFDRFYRSTNSGLKTLNGKFRNQLDAPTIASDWDGSPLIECGKGLHVVYGHPLYAVSYVQYPKHRFFRVDRDDMGEVVPSKNCDGKFRTNRITLRSKNELGPVSDEFASQELLAKIAMRTPYPGIREMALKMLTSKTVIADTVLMQKCPGSLAIALIKKIDNKRLLAKLSKDSDVGVAKAAKSRLRRLAAK